MATSIRIASIHVGDRLRILDPAWVAFLAEDIAANGLRVVPGEDFPLPPEHLVDALDNSSGPAEPAKAAAPAASAVRQLDFVDGVPQIVVPLRFPFRLDGRVVENVTVRALAVEETGAIVAQQGATNVSVFDFYAAMTGLPADVVRALPGSDGDDVTNAGWGFLPRFMKRGDGD